MLDHRRVTPWIKLAGTHLYTWVERVTVRVKCLAQEHNTMSLARARTQTAQSGDEANNREVTAPPYNPDKKNYLNSSKRFFIEKQLENNSCTKKAKSLFIRSRSSFS